MFWRKNRKKENDESDYMLALTKELKDISDLIEEQQAQITSLTKSLITLQESCIQKES